MIHTERKYYTAIKHVPFSSFIDVRRVYQHRHGRYSPFSCRLAHKSEVCEIKKSNASFAPRDLSLRRSGFSTARVFFFVVVVVFECYDSEKQKKFSGLL